MLPAPQPAPAPAPKYYTPADLESDYTPPGGASFNTHTSYNLDQQVSSVSRPDGDFVTPTWDAAKGRLSSFTTSLGTTTLGYSPTTGQVTSVTTPDGVGLTYAYDGALLKSVTSSGPIAGSVQRSYDASFRISSETYGGQTISYGYDNDDLLTSAGAMTIARDSATGFVSGATLGSVSETRTYNAFGEEQSSSSSFGSTPLYSVDYGTRDALGRIVTKTETVQGETHVFGYSYDAQGRLTDVTRDGTATSHYEYDANGNRTVAPGLTASPVYDNQDRLLSYGNCTYGYKADGSLQAKTCPDGTSSYDYDAFGNLRHVTLPSGTNIDYLIDGQNRRIGKKVNGVLVEGFLYRNQLQPVVWLNGDGSVRATFVYGLRPNVPEYMVQGGTAYRLITDQVGTVRLVVNTATGAVVERIDWDEFGNVLADSAPGMQPFGFAGGLRDLDTGLMRFGARDYDPVTGRWTQKDPIYFRGGINLYSYAAGDPINSHDPTGLRKLSRCEQRILSPLMPGFDLASVDVETVSPDVLRNFRQIGDADGYTDPSKGHVVFISAAVDQDTSYGFGVIAHEIAHLDFFDNPLSWKKQTDYLRRNETAPNDYWNYYYEPTEKYARKIQSRAEQSFSIFGGCGECGP